MLAGAAGGGLKPGRYLQAPNVAHNRLFVSSCQLMGLSTVKSFSTTDAGSGGLAGMLNFALSRRGAR